jgi:hypothetical protein
MITDETSGVWETWDVFAKANKGVYPYVGAPALFSWGDNANGQLGQNDTTNSFITSTNTRNLMEFYKWWW